MYFVVILETSGVETQLLTRLPFFPPTTSCSTHCFLPPAAVVLDPQSWCGPAERLALALARQQISSQQVALELDHFQLHDDSHFSTTATSECCCVTSSC